MNNKNKILVGCLSLLLVLSVGYALFSETITINGTATAKGSFDITTTCETGINSKLGNSYIEKNGEDGGYENDTCSVKDNTVTFNTDFLYPGAKRYFTVKFINSGTIDVVYNDADLLINEEMCAADNLEGSNLSCSNTIHTNGVIYLNGYGGNSTLELAALEDPNGNLLSQSEALQYWNPDTKTFLLKSGYSLYMYFRLRIFHQQTPAPAGEMFVEYTSTFELPFTQAIN